MKRKVTKVGNFRFSPNEEALLLKEEFERRRKQRLLQVREQERCIALQIRQEVKQRRDQHLHHLAEELRVEWQKTQEQKIKELEKLYVASLRSVGEGHRAAKENAPGLDDLIKQREERQQRAEERGQEALKKMKNEKEKLLKQKAWYVETHKKVLLEEKERAAKIASLPPPPPNPFEAVLTLKTCYLPGKGANVQVKGISTLKTKTASNHPTYHHLDPSVISEEKDLEQNLQLKQISKITSTTTTTACSTYNFEPTVERVMEVQQPDPHLAAEEETKRMEELQKEAIKERREQLEKAHIRGVHAMRKVHLAKGREKIMKELEQLQQEDLARRRQNVAQMPPQVVELPHKRMAIKEDWQRELEFAFEDMYNADRKVKGDLILKLEPEPLPVVTELIQDEELDLSMEQDYTSVTQNQERMEEETPVLIETDIPEAQETHHASSKTVLKKLLDRIQSQRSQWANKYTPEDESEMPKIFPDGESETLTVETGTIASEEKPLDKSEHTQKRESSESEISLLDERLVLLHPHEEATQVTTVMKRQKEMMKLEQQKQKQMELIRQIEQQRIKLESECLKAQKTQLEHEREKMKERTQQFYLRCMKSYPFMDQWKKEANVVSQHLIDDTPTLDLKISREDHSRQVIHNYQQHLLQQNRFHRQSIDAARKRLHEYQNMLKQRYPSRSAKSFSSDFVKLKGESLDRKILTFQATSHLPEVPELPSLHSLPSYPVITGDSHLLSTESSEKISSDQTSLSYSQSLLTEHSLRSEPSLSSVPSAESESKFERIQDLFSAKNQSPQSSSHFINLEDRHVISPDYILSQKESLKTVQEHLDIQRKTLYFNEKIPEELVVRRQPELEERIHSSQSDSSSLVPLFPQHSLSFSPAAEPRSGSIREHFSFKSDSIVPSSHSLMQIIPDKLLSSSEDMLHQQYNLNTIRKQLNMQREALHLCLKAHKLASAEEKVLSSQTGSSPFLPLVPQCSFSSSLSAESESGGIHNPLARIHEPECLSGGSSIQEPLNVQREALCFSEGTQEELLVQSKIALEERLSPNQTASSFLPLIPQHSFTSLPSTESGDIQIASSRPATPNIHIFQEKLLASSEHIIPHEDDLNLHQEQLAVERKALQFSQRAQQQTTLSERLLSDQSNSSLAEHTSSSPPSTSEEIQNPPVDKNESTLPSSNSTILLFQDRVSTSGNGQCLQDNLETVQEELNIQREAPFFGHRSQLHYLDHKLDAVEERTSSQTDSSLSLPLFPLRSVSSLPSAETESNSDFGGFQEPFLTSGENAFPSSQASIHTFQDKLLASSKHFSAAQDNLKELQKQLNIKREFFKGRQKSQEEWLLQRQTGPKQEQKHKEALKDSLYEIQTNKSTLQNVKEAEKTMQFRELILSQIEERNHQEEFSHADKSKCDDSELLSENIDPGPHHTGQLQNRELRQRLSKPPVAKIRSGLDLNQHELSAIQEVESPKSGRASIRGQAKDVVNENHGLFSYAADLEQKVPVYPGSAFKPKKIVPPIPWPTNDLLSQSHAQELQDDQSSSLTVSTGSFLSNEKSRLNLANSELEQTFPHLHHQLFNAVEPRPDLDFSSSLSQSGLSQDLSKTTYPSTPESQDVSGSHESTTSNTTLRASLHSSLDINLYSAMNRTGVTLDSSQTEDFPKEKIILAMSEESFRALQPESTPSDSSHSTDLLSTEAEGPSQSFKKEKFPLRKQYEELLIHNRSADFSPSVAVLQSPTFSSSDDPHLFDKVRVPHSTPYDSSSSKSSTKDQMESRKEDLGFEELSDEMKRSQIEVIASAQSEANSRCVVRDPETHSERSSEENVEVFRDTPQPPPSSFLISLRSCSLQSSIPVWETTSGHGIMEEAELTLISSSDNSVTDSDLENLIQEENKGSELKSCFQVKQDSELKEDYSFWKPDLTVTEPPEERPTSSFQHPDTFQEFSSAPGSLQEVFVKKNNSFIEQSSQRQKEIKNRAQTSGKSQPKSALEIESKKHPVERKPSEPTTNQLKKVNEVKVCFPEDRKTVKALQHQRALRSCNQLTEVRQQKEEESREEAYARTREKAKEFHRKTLEKLRAKTFH